MLADGRLRGNGRDCASRASRTGRCPAATDTLRLSTAPASGMPTAGRSVRASAGAAPGLRRPAPTRSVRTRRRRTGSRRRSSAPSTHTPRSFSSRSVRARLVTAMTGTVSAAPLAAFATVALRPTARSFGTITACAPNASALRRQAPRLCGSVTPSSTSSSAGSAQVRQHVVERHVRPLRIDDRDHALVRRVCRRASRAARRRRACTATPLPFARAARSRMRASCRRRVDINRFDGLRTLAQPRDDGVKSEQGARGGHGLGRMACGCR